jgi:predicted SprT family Zn-dependent metalloprotease
MDADRAGYTCRICNARFGNAQPENEGRTICKKCEGRLRAAKASYRSSSKPRPRGQRGDK